MRPHTLAILVVGLVPVSGCSSSAPHKHIDDAIGEQDTPTAPRRGDGNVPSIDAEVGALDPDAVDRAFEAARSPVKQCFQAANAELDFQVIGGDLEVEVRVKNDGSVRWVYPRSSNVGHLGAETCVLDVLRRQTWPRPEGGDEGIARTRFGLDAPGRAPVAWTPADLGGKGGSLEGALRACKQGSALSVTVYVDADGKVIAAGGASGDERGIDSIGCAVEAAKRASFPSPGSYPAKVTLSVE
jgi:hypothetical protein